MTEMRSSPKAINVPDISPADDGFTVLATGRPIQWVRLSGLPDSAIEHRLARFKLARYRAAWQATRAVTDNSFVVSHLPMMTAAVQQLFGLTRKSPPHLAFAFNFTNLPTGNKFRYLRSLFQQVDQFAIFSRYERELYASTFDLPPGRFVPTLWTQDVPPASPVEQSGADAPFLCAIGGEGRDFSLLMDACARLPRLRIVVIARPQSLEGLTVPPNVEVMVNRPLEEVWALAGRSCGVLVPLLRPDTCCGHVTLVGAKLRGIPLLTTASLATAEYVDGRDSVLQCSAGDAQAFAQLAERLVDERTRIGSLARAIMPAERAIHNRRLWADYLTDFVDRHFS